MKNLLIRLAMIGGVLAVSGPASASQYVWDLYKSDSTSNSHSFTFDDGSGHMLTVYAYRSGNTDGTGKLVTANVNPSGSEGLGVTSCTVNTTGSCASGEDSSDSRLLDNRSGYDVLVFDSNVANFDWNFLTAGWIESGSCCDESPEIAYWTGNGAGNADSTFLNNLCLSGPSSCALDSNGFKGFQLTASAADTKLPLSPQAQGRYLVVSGALDGSSSGTDYEKFKIKTVPTPETISLVGIGLLAMLGIRRRKGVQRLALC